jgi:hypothetical protein
MEVVGNLDEKFSFFLEIFTDKCYLYIMPDMEVMNEFERKIGKI